MKVKYTGNELMTVVFEIEAATKEEADELALNKFKRTLGWPKKRFGYELIREDPYEEVERYGM